MDLSANLNFPDEFTQIKAFNLNLDFFKIYAKSWMLTRTGQLPCIHRVGGTF